MSTLTYDAENRVTSVTKSGYSATFVAVYPEALRRDGDGNRVKSTINGVTTTFIGNYFEWHTDANDKVRYYYAGGQRIAMRQGNGTGISNLTYLFGDQLGSTSLTFKADTYATTTTYESFPAAVCHADITGVTALTERKTSPTLKHKCQSGCFGTFFCIHRAGDYAPQGPLSSK